MELDNQRATYCPACFKSYASDCRSFDENGNCRIHGGWIGQTFNVTKTQQKVRTAGLLGAIVLVIAGSLSKKT